MAKKKMGVKAPSSKKGRRGGRTPGRWVQVTQEAVKEFRKKSGLSRGKLAELLGVSSTSIQNWETGHSVPIPRFQQKLAELMNGGVPVPAPAARPSDRAAGAAVTGGGSTELQVARLTVTGEILKGYLGTAQGGKVSPEQLIALTKALSAALG